VRLRHRPAQDVPAFDLIRGHTIMTRTSCAIIIGSVFIASAACDDDNPIGPSTNTVVIYEDTNFRGNSRAMLGNAADLDALPGCGGAGADWDGCISSIRIPSGWEVSVFEHDDYTGASATFTADVPDLHLQQGPCGGDWDDCISSIQLRQR